MKLLQEIKDPIFVSPLAYNSFDKFFLKLIRDKRDLPFVRLTVKLSLIIIPLAILLFLPLINGWWWIAFATGYFALNMLFIGPFSLMLHCTSHRTFFKKEYNYLNYYLPWILALFFGHSPETYYAHHIGMHHAENNLEDDESTTMPYQRDSIRGFLHYFGTFLFTGIYHLASYFFKKNRKRLLYRSVRGELLFIAFCVALCFLNWPATLVVFIIPFFMFRLIAMLGNWAQHAFIDASNPGDSYKNSITCINTKYNHDCWNDGYHISHHLKQAMHWTEHPEFFKSTLKDYADNDAIVFDNLDFVQVFFCLMFKKYNTLAKNFVNLNNKFSSDAEVIEFLKQRTKRISISAEEPIPAYN